MIQLKGLSSKTTYTAKLYLEGTVAAQATIALTEVRPGFYEGVTAGLAAGSYYVDFLDDITSVGDGIYCWDGVKEITSLTLDSAVALTAKTSQLTTAKDEILTQGNTAWLTGNTVAPNNADIAAAKTAAESVNTKLTTVRATKLDTVTVQADLNPLATGAALAAVQTSVNAIPAVNLTPTNNAIAAVQYSIDNIEVIVPPIEFPTYKIKL